VNKLQQRYFDTIVESGQAFSEGGAETFANWLTSPLLHYSWDRDSEDRSSQVQIQVNYKQLGLPTNLFIVSHYNRKITTTTTAGFVSSVNALSI
jgi:hypothetical protein